MAREVRRYSVTVPAGTTAASPQVTDLAMPARLVRSILWRVPPGPRGVMGFRIGSSRTQVIPWNTGEWIVADDESDEMPLEHQITSGAWQCIAYNTGTHDHTVYLTFYLDPAPAARTGFGGQIPGDQLGSGGSGGSGSGSGGSGSGSGSGGGGGLDPGDPPEGSTPAYADGWARARHNAIVAAAVALGYPDVPAPVERPAAGGDAAAGYDDAKAEALAVLGDLEATTTAVELPDSDGARIARERALAALYGALGGSYGGAPPIAPAFGTPERAEYDDAKARIVAALEGL